jgi:hypothetical protein
VSRATGIPATGTVLIEAHVVSATGGFAGFGGELTFRGVVNVLAGSLGDYAGQLVAPRP